jgi:phage terminase large subunit
LTALKIKTAPVFAPLLQPSRFKGAYGGRGGGKSSFFGELLVEDCYREPGMRAVCMREFQRTLADSSKPLIEDKIRDWGWVATLGSGKTASKRRAMA